MSPTGRRKRHTALSVLLFLVSVFLSLPAGPRAAHAAEKVVLGIPVPAMSMMPIFIAQDKGLFQKEGLDPKIVYVRGRVAVPALVSGEIGYSASVETAMRAAMQGMPFRIVLYTSAKLSVSLITPAAIHSVADLKGRTIGVTSLGGSMDYTAREILAKKGLNPAQDVRIVGLGETEQAAGLESGALQGAMLTPPYDAIMEQKGFRRLVFAADLIDYPQGGLVTTIKRIQENPAQVKRTIGAVLLSLIYIRENRDDLLSYIAKRWKIDRAVAAASYETMLRSFSRDGTANPRSIQNVIESTRTRLKLRRTFAVSDLVDFSLLEAVKREMKIK